MIADCFVEMEVMSEAVALLIEVVLSYLMDNTTAWFVILNQLRLKGYFHIEFLDFVVFTFVVNINDNFFTRTLFARCLI